MAFNLRIPTDGHGVNAAHVTMSFLEGSLNMNEVYKHMKEKPIEFDVSPSNGVIMPLSEIELQVVLMQCFNQC